MSIRKVPDGNKIIFVSLIGTLVLVTVAVSFATVNKSRVNKANKNSLSFNIGKEDNNSIVNSTESYNNNHNNSMTDNEVGEVSLEETVSFQIPPDNYSSEVEVNDEYVERELRDFATSMKERKKWSFDKVTNRDISFNAKYSKDYVEMNTLLYQIVNKYFNSANFGDTFYRDYIDPLYLMAVSNVEFGYATSPDVLLAPAIPTSKGVKVTKENLLTFGIVDYLEYPSVLRIDRDGYRGPLQMYATGMSKGIIPEDLVGSEYTRLLAAKDCQAKKEELALPQYIEGSGTSSTLDGMRIKNQTGKYGDRFNYGDAVNRLSGNIKNCWDMYENSQSIDKYYEHAIDTKFAFMAMTAIGHNSSPGIYYVGDNKTLGKQHYWWPFGSFGQAREYCHYLGQEECVSYIKEIAMNNLSKGSLSSVFKLSRVQGYRIAEELVAKGCIPEGLWKRTCWNHEEKIGYPIQVIYNYFILEAIYEGM